MAGMMGKRKNDPVEQDRDFVYGSLGKWLEYSSRLNTRQTRQDRRDVAHQSYEEYYSYLEETGYDFDVPRYRRFAEREFNRLESDFYTNGKRRYLEALHRVDEAINEEEDGQLVLPGAKFTLAQNGFKDAEKEFVRVRYDENSTRYDGIKRAEHLDDRDWGTYQETADVLIDGLSKNSAIYGRMIMIMRQTNTTNMHDAIRAIQSA